MRGLVLAAGLGTRMRPLTEHVPKALITVCGRTLLDRALSFLALHGIGPLAVNAHHLHQHLEDHRRYSSIPFEISWEKECIRGTGGALWWARDFLSRDESFAVCNIEPVLAFQFAPILERFSESNADAALVGVPVSENGTIFADPANSDFLGTRSDPLDRDTSSQFCFLGLTLYRRRFLDVLDESDFAIQPVWRRARSAGLRVIVIPVSGQVYWRDVGAPIQLAQAHFDVLDRTAPWRLPESMTLDCEKKSAFPRKLDLTRLGGLGYRVWFEAESIPAGSSFENCVVLAGSRLQGERRYENILVTPWGEVLLG